MNTLITSVKKIPWWAWIAIAVLILFVVNQASSYFYNRSLFGIALDGIRADQSRVVKTLEDNQKMYESEINRLTDQLRAIKQKQVAAENESARLRGLVREKDSQIALLKKERDTIVIPDDLDAIANEFRKRGYKPRVMLPR